MGQIEQTREQDPRYQIGAGKIRELARLVKRTGTQKIIFDNPLKPVQAYNIAKATTVEAIDRFQLILEIFARRATTKEAKLQIKLAKLRYELTQAKEKVRLARKEEQPGFMGLGAYEVDVYYETVKRQAQSIRGKLKKIRRRRSLHRERRVELGFQSISLAGYTNAGKSTLFNALTEEEVPVDEALFITLSTTTRLVEMGRKKFLLTDTVGFIDRLPLPLIESFHSTLEETIYSNLILLLVDASEKMSLIEKKLSICMETVSQIGASGIPIITVLTKVDLLPETKLNKILEKLKGRAPNPVAISALHKLNLDLLKQKVLNTLKNYIQASITIPLNNESMSFISWLFDRAEIIELKYVDKSTHMTFEAVPWFAQKVKKRVKEEFNGKFKKI